MKHARTLMQIRITRRGAPTSNLTRDSDTQRSALDTQHVCIPGAESALFAQRVLGLSPAFTMTLSSLLLSSSFWVQFEF
jgi:hypothetical protein